MKSIKFFIVMLLLICTIGIFNNSVYADSYNVNEKVDLGQYNIYSRTGGTYITYQGRPQPNYMYYYKDFNNVEHKAFCLNLGMTGAEEGDYIVDANKLVDDPKVASILTSGSPYRTIEELGLNNEDEASFATQFALWIYQNNLDINAIAPYSSENQNVVDAIKRIYYDGINNVYESRALIEIEKVGNSEIDNINREYYSQTYKINYNENIKYIKLTIPDEESVLITDINNNVVENVENLTEFKVLIPRKNIENNKTINLHFEIEAKQTSVMFGATTKDQWQNMGLLLNPVNINNISESFDVSYQGANIEIKKVDKDTGKGISGVKFKFETLEGELIGEYITGENGIIKLDAEKDLKLLGEQKIKVTEIQVPEEYYIDEENCTQVIEVKYGETAVAKFVNEKIKGKIKVIKLSSNDNKYTSVLAKQPLKDVVFEVLDINNNVVDTIVTDENGVAETKVLLKGVYKIREIKQAKYYLLNNEIYEVEIKIPNKVEEKTIYNDSVDIDIEIEKYGFIETQNKDNIFYNFKNIHNKSNVPLDNFTWNDTLPTDAVRIDKIYTGTWNEKLSYSVWYKTNKSDFKLVKDNLDSETVYELDFNELNSQDEYVTEFEFRFGTVKVDFHELESPILYVNVIDSLKNGYTFTNNTKVSGNYIEEYIKDEDNWTTIVYNKEINKNLELPKTGI